MQASLKSIFHHAKDGDVLGFLNKGLAIIPFLTEDKNDKGCSHVARIWNVRREKNAIYFAVSEQTMTHGGLYRPVCIMQKENGEYYTDDRYFNKQKAIYHLRLKYSLSDEQREAGIIDAKSQEGKKYGFKTLFWFVRFFENILPKKWQLKIQKQMLDGYRVCSTHVAKSLLITKNILQSQLNKYNIAITPWDVLTFPCFENAFTENDR